MISSAMTLKQLEIVNPQVVIQLVVAVPSKRPITSTQQAALKMIKNLGRGMFSATT